ncbi:Myotubularin- protein 9 [Actinomortierella ambigua]|uniref:Myotubularin- protein 9 n=1 Tax=Actinomortierella ambigua TaxID=1343610 RepID=A0A9P6U2Q5_9FUNG|nr:Myotubularin- protein 9 [Actinomortierella ambigua]
MDPYFRTIRGLRALIEKEWLFCGHPFQARNDCHQQRFHKHHTSSLHQNGSKSSPGHERSTEGWASGGPPVLLSSPNGKSERLSAIPNLSTFTRPNWMKTTTGGDSGRTTSLKRISNPFSRSSGGGSQDDSWRGLPSNRADIPTSDHPYPPSPAPTEIASDSTMEEGFVYSSSSSSSFSSRYKSRFAKDVRATTPQGDATIATTATTHDSSVGQPKTNPSPVFLLFLTCLHHILQQHADQFEYNDYLLLLLAKAASGFSPFGDFLFNTERERAQAQLRENTVSVWAWIDRHRGLVTHAGYTRSSQQQQQRGGGDHRTTSSSSSKTSSTSTSSPSPSSSSSLSSSMPMVLPVQTGGRYISIWSEYYFDALASAGTHPLDPVTIMASSPIFHPHAPTSRARRVLATDFWHATLLATTAQSTGMTTAVATMTAAMRKVGDGHRTLQPMTTAFHLSSPIPFPGAEGPSSYGNGDATISGPSPALPLPPKSFTSARPHENGSPFMEQRPPTAQQTIEHHLDFVRWKYVRDQYEGEYWSLVSFLRRKRHARAREVFKKWAQWAKTEPEVSTGWVVAGRDGGCEAGGGVAVVGRNDGRIERRKGERKAEEAGDDEQGLHRPLPMMVAHTSRRELMVEMEEILDTDQEAFFGDHPVVFEEVMDESLSEEGSSEQDEGMMGMELESSFPRDFHKRQLQLLQNGSQRVESIYSDDGFDDLGFPVRVDDL